MALTQHAQPDGPGRLTFSNCAFDLLITFPTLAYTVFGSLLLVLEDIPNKVGILLLRICSQLPADVSSLASGTPSPQLSLLSLGLRVSGASLIYLGLVAGACYMYGGSLNQLDQWKRWPHFFGYHHQGTSRKTRFGITLSFWIRPTDMPTTSRKLPLLPHPCTSPQTFEHPPDAVHSQGPGRVDAVEATIEVLDEEEIADRGRASAPVVPPEPQEEPSITGSDAESSRQGELETGDVSIVLSTLKGELSYTMKRQDQVVAEVSFGNSRWIALLGFLAVYGRGQKVPTSRIKQAVYEDMAENTFNTHMSRMREHLKSVCQSAGLPHLSPFENSGKGQRDSWCSLSGACKVDISVLEYWYQRIVVEKKSGTDPTERRAACQHLAQLHVDGFLARHLYEDGFNPWAGRFFTQYRDHYLHILRHAAEGEYVLGQQEEGERQQECFRYAAIYWKEYALAALRTIPHTERSEQALRQSFAMCRLAGDRQAALDTYHAYSDLLAFECPGVSLEPKTIKAWQDAIGE